MKKRHIQEMSFISVKSVRACCNTKIAHSEIEKELKKFLWNKTILCSKILKKTQYNYHTENLCIK